MASPGPDEGALFGSPAEAASYRQLHDEMCEGARTIVAWLRSNRTGDMEVRMSVSRSVAWAASYPRTALALHREVEGRERRTPG